MSEDLSFCYCTISIQRPPIERLGRLGKLDTFTSFSYFYSAVNMRYLASILEPICL